MISPAQATEVRKGEYHITRSPGRPVPPERHPYLFAISSSVRLILWSLYIGYRYGRIRQTQIGQPNILLQLWIVLFAEFFLSLDDILTTFGIVYPLFTLKSFPVRPRYCLTGSSAPTIDVCVTCCGESADIVANTIAAAALQDYPPHRFRVILLDDGRDRKLKVAIETLGKKNVNGPQILYRSRKPAPDARSYYKAGNLQYGLKETEELGASQFFAVLDADMIPQSDWLRKTIPHLILDDAVALACPPQVSSITFLFNLQVSIQATYLCSWINIISFQFCSLSSPCAARHQA